MNSTHRLWIVAVAAAASIGAMVAQAQLERATPDELARRGAGPPTINTANGPKPNTDPRDFSGSWRQARGGGPPGAGGAPRAGGPPPVDPDANPAGNRGAVSGRLPDRILCLPQSDPTYTGVDGPTLIVQTPEQIVWAAEEMHHIRRIFLTGTATPKFARNYLGESLGRWEGNTLIVETQGLRAQPDGSKLVERWSKSADGATINISHDVFDATGKAAGRARTMNLGWTSGQPVYEWICEDFNEEWLPGGADFDDQVAK